MLHTSPAQLKRFLELIAPVEPYFIPVVKLGKEPAVLKDESWKLPKYHLSPEAAMKRLEAGANVGLVGMIGGVGILDVEYENILRADNYIPLEIQQTLLGKSRNGGLHLFFKNLDCHNKDLTIERKTIIEARMDFKYVLAPGSFVPPENSKGTGLYHLIQELPPLDLKAEMLPWLKKNQTPGCVKFTDPVNFEGGFMGLPCVKLLFTVRLTSGRRTRGPKLLGIAWGHDHPESPEGLREVMRAYVVFQSDQTLNVPYAPALGFGRSAIRNNRTWNCGELITLFRENGIYPPCSGCALKEAPE